MGDEYYQPFPEAQGSVGSSDADFLCLGSSKYKEDRCQKEGHSRDILQVERVSKSKVNSSCKM